MMSEKIPHPPIPARLRLAGIVFAIFLVVMAVLGIMSRIRHEHELQKQVDTQHMMVKVVMPESGKSEQRLILPVNIRADVDAPIYARVNGYLKTWYTDIGAHVKKGQLLGEIETPELDQQIFRAKADVSTAHSNWEIADVTAKRWQNLVKTDAVSHQESDVKTADAKARLDLLNAAEANLKALMAEQSFQRLVAPFDGIVTERNTDIGHLISVGTTSGQALFRVVDNTKLRIYTEIPQNYASWIKPKMTVHIVFPEMPGDTFDATVLGLSNAIREDSRTSQVELYMDNKDGKILTGSYAEVHFELPANTSVFRLPVSTLLFRKEGLQVATVGTDNKVLLKNITIARDLGRVVEVSSGIDNTDRVIDSPSDSIVQGAAVVIKEAKGKSGAEVAGHEPEGAL